MTRTGENPATGTPCPWPADRDPVGGLAILRQAGGAGDRHPPLGEQGAEEVLTLLRPSVSAVYASGIMPEVNPTGLPRAG